MTCLSCLHSLWWEIYCHCTIICSVVFFSGCFLYFSSYLVLCSVIMMCLYVNFLEFDLGGVHSASWTCKYMPFAKFGTFSSIISSGIFSVPQYFSLLWDSNKTNVRFFFWYCFSDPRISVHYFKSFFSILFILDNFYWSMFKYTQLFLLKLHSVIEHVQ